MSHSPSSNGADDKNQTDYVEAGRQHSKTGDIVLSELATTNVHVSDEDNKRIKRKTDLVILSALMIVYFFQTADKTIIGITAVYGLKTDANLQGNDYSNIGSIGYYAQLVAQPLAAFLLVKLRYRLFFPIIVICWGTSLLGMAASHNYTTLMATRFLLGWFEASVLPLFSIITIAWYRRTEQPLRVALWYGTNGLANVFCSPIIYGLARIPNPTIYVYQITYIFFGVLTVLVGIAGYWWLSDSPDKARFLSPEDRVKAVERLKANQQGIRHFGFNFHQVIESLLEIKFYLFMMLTICINIGASTSSVFGPTILNTIIGFTPDQSVLLNMPYGFLQTIMILLGSWLSVRFKTKGIILFIFVLPVIAGTAMLYALPQTKANQGPLLLGYYLFAFLYAGNPLIISWMAANIAGQTKKATYYAGYNASSAIGNIVAPYLFQAKDKPTYHPALTGVFIVFAICAGVALTQIFNIFRLQKMKERQRVAAGFPAKIKDYSMESQFQDTDEAEVHGGKALQDATDQENLFFVYLI